MTLRSKLFLGGATSCLLGTLALGWMGYSFWAAKSQISQNLSEISPPFKQRQAPALKEAIPLESKELAAYRPVLDKPLFSPSRRLEQDPPPPPKIIAKPKVVTPVKKVKAAPVKKAPPPPPPPKELLLSLVGVVVLNGTPQVLVKSQTDGEFLRLAKGQSHNDWQVKSILEDSVEFSHGELVKVLAFEKPE